MPGGRPADISFLIQDLSNEISITARFSSLPEVCQRVATIWGAGDVSDAVDSMMIFEAPLQDDIAGGHGIFTYFCFEGRCFSVEAFVKAYSS